MGTNISLMIFATSDHQPIKSKIAMIGFEGSGKSTLMNKFDLGKFVNISMHTLKEDAFASWQEDCHDVDAIIFVIDSTNEMQLGSAVVTKKSTTSSHSSVSSEAEESDNSLIDQELTVASEISRIIENDSLEGIPLLILANKQDIPRAMSAIEIEHRLKLEIALKHSRPWRIQACSASSTEGLNDGCAWLGEALQP
jgi:signal recognition particle receptor subunit beta